MYVAQLRFNWAAIRSCTGTCSPATRPAAVTPALLASLSSVCTARAHNSKLTATPQHSESPVGLHHVCQARGAARVRQHGAR